MNLPTDIELEKRAIEIAQKDFDDNGSSEALAGIYAAALEALKIDRESYRLLMVEINELQEDIRFTGNKQPIRQRIAEIATHLTTLRTRLGITE